MASSNRAATTFSALNILPLLIFPLVIYNVVTLFSADPSWVAGQPFAIHLISNDNWGVSYGDIFVALSLLLLFVEIVKSTRTDASSIINHGLSMALALVCVLQFVTMRGFGTSEFFFLTLMQALDVIAGFTVTIVAAKRDFGSAGGIAGTN
ncbi:MAG: hypothetical protein K8S25_07030 [Alphaproteobacteria bacterium]|nr:hypothetical protein [Alphaproteobacteria bacterium]